MRRGQSVRCSTTAKRLWSNVIRESQTGQATAVRNAAVIEPPPDVGRGRIEWSCGFPPRLGRPTGRFRLADAGVGGHRAPPWSNCRLASLSCRWSVASPVAVSGCRTFDNTR